MATFQFVGVPDKKNTAGGMRAVTEGKIDLPYTGQLSPVPETIGQVAAAGDPEIATLPFPVSDTVPALAFGTMFP